MASCIKNFLVLYNFFIGLFGLALCTLATCFWWDSAYFNDVGQYYITPFFLFLALGFLVAIVGFIGCWGSFRQSRMYLLIYFLLSLLLCVGGGASLYWTYNNQATLIDEIELNLLKMVKLSYGMGRTNATEILIDKVQQDFACCGINEPNEWKVSLFNEINNKLAIYSLPHSCCDQKEPMCKLYVNAIYKPLEEIDGLYNEPCMPKLRKSIKNRWLLIMFMGTTVLLAQLFPLGFVCAFCFIIPRRNEPKQTTEL